MTTESDPRGIDTPSFAAQPAERPRAEKWVWLACGVLLVTLMVMLLVAGRASLARDARTRPLAERACAVLGCSVPAWRDSSAFRMLEHDVRAEPSMPGVLRVVGGFRNEAPWPQEWPVLVLSLKDAGGEVLAQRALTPAEYLPAQHPAQLGAGQTASVRFHVREPERAAVAFDFAFQSATPVAFSDPAGRPR